MAERDRAVNRWDAIASAAVGVALLLGAFFQWKGAQLNDEIREENRRRYGA